MPTRAEALKETRFAGYLYDSLAACDTEMTDMPSPKPTSAILDTVRDAREFLAELGDKALELATESTVLDNVPVVSWAVKALKIRDTYQQFRLKRNCEALMRALVDSREDDIARFREEMEKDPDAAEDFSDTTLSILLESEKPLKARLYGKLLRSRIRCELPHAEFEALSLLIQAASIPALKAIPTFFEGNEHKAHTHRVPPEEPLLLSLGVATRHGTKFTVVESGQQLYRICFGGVVRT